MGKLQYHCLQVFLEIVRLSRENFSKPLLEPIGLAALLTRREGFSMQYICTHLIPFLSLVSLPSSASQAVCSRDLSPVFCQRYPALLCGEKEML